MSAYSTVTVTPKVAIELLVAARPHKNEDKLRAKYSAKSYEVLGDLLDKHVSDTPGWALVNFLVNDYSGEDN